MPGRVGTYVTVNPAITGGYVYSMAAATGVVAANNFLALTNPVGSGKVLAISGVFISSVVVADIAATVDPMRGWLATSVSGGNLESASTIAKAHSMMPSSAGQIRTANPSATLGASWFNSPPILGASKTSSPFVHQVPSILPAGPLMLLAGESTVLRTESGDVDQRWNLSIAWTES